MPSVSKAQVRKMAVLHKQGKITDKQWEDYKPKSSSSWKKLPERKTKAKRR